MLNICLHVLFYIIFVDMQMKYIFYGCDKWNNRWLNNLVKIVFVYMYLIDFEERVYVKRKSFKYTVKYRYFKSLIIKKMNGNLLYTCHKYCRFYPFISLSNPDPYFTTDKNLFPYYNYVCKSLCIPTRNTETCKKLKCCY